MTSWMPNPMHHCLFLSYVTSHFIPPWNSHYLISMIPHSPGFPLPCLKQTGIKIARLRNINILKYADDTTLKAERKEKLKEPLDESERGEWKSWLKAQRSENEDHGLRSITSWRIDGETVETVTDLICLGSKITADGDCSHKIKDVCSLEEKLWPT